MAQQMLRMVRDHAEESGVGDLDEILGELGARPQDLFWKEDDAGVLYGAAARNHPETIARIALYDGGITAEEVDPDEVDWRAFDMLSAPESAIRDRQFD